MYLKYFICRDGYLTCEWCCTMLHVHVYCPNLVFLCHSYMYSVYIIYSVILLITRVHKEESIEWAVTVLVLAEGRTIAFCCKTC